MKRITYMSRLSFPVTDNELEEIRAVSIRNNQQNNITGVLIYFGDLFFQIIEGDDDKLTRLYEKILKDDRHTDIVCLKTELDVEERLFPEWSMTTINLDHSTNALIRPVRILLNSLVESHGVIEKYTQSAVLKMINAGMNPLHVEPRKTEKIVLLSDIVSFSLMSEKLPVEDISMLVNEYFEICTQILSRYGGEVTKYIGDSVLAYFDPVQADTALQASMEILEELAKLRKSVPANSVLRLLYSGIGLSKGAVVEGNLGSSVKMDYTIIGDPVNIAARLEGLTRQVKKSLVMSAELKNSLKQDWTLEDLGIFALKGKKVKVQAFSLANPLVDELMTHEQFIENLAFIMK
jgi:adenylate cyclase